MLKYGWVSQGWIVYVVPLSLFCFTKSKKNSSPFYNFYNRLFNTTKLNNVNNWMIFGSNNYVCGHYSRPLICSEYFYHQCSSQLYIQLYYFYDSEDNNRNRTCELRRISIAVIFQLDLPLGLICFLMLML